MTRLFLLAALLALPATASAQVHSGVALSSIVAPNERVLSVEAPDAWELPARVRLSCGAATACARIDVWVAETEADADARLAAALATSSSTVLVPRHDVGEVAHADRLGTGATLVLAMRDNVVFRVLALETTADAAAIALRIDAAVLAAPTGDARSTRADPDGAIVAPSEGTTIVVQPPAGILAVSVTATGDSSARRVSGGWSLTRGTGAFELLAWVVDDELRVGNIGISWDPDSHEDRR